MSTNDNQVEEVHVAYPQGSDLHLRLSVGACQLRIKPGESADWVTGTYRHPLDTLPLKIEQQGGSVRISQETSRWAGLWGVMDRNTVPRFDLAIGRGQPFTLTLELGASDNEIDLGGLPIRQLTIKQGAGRAVIDFSAPNPQAMKALELSAGAAGLEMRRLANANCNQMRAEGGAAAYQFNFDGQLAHDMQVTIITGMAGVDIDTPAGTAMKATVEAVIGGVDVGDGFMKKEGAYWNEAALAGKTPVLNVQAKITMGGLKLRTVAAQNV